MTTIKNLKKVCTEMKNNLPNSLNWGMYVFYSPSKREVRTSNMCDENTWFEFSADDDTIPCGWWQNPATMQQLQDAVEKGIEDDALGRCL